MEQMKCTQCGTLIQGGRFCPKCGSPAPQTQVPAGQTPMPTGQSVNMSQEKSESKGKKKAVVPIVVSVLLCLVIIGTGISASTIFIIRNGFSKASVKSAVRKVEFTKMKVGSLVKIKNGDKKEKKEKLPDLIYDSIAPSFREKMGDRETALKAIEDIIEEDFVQDFVSEKAGDYMSDILTGSGKGTIEVDELVDLLKENRDELANLTEGSYKFSDKDFKAMEDYLKHNDVLESLQLSELKEDNRSAFDTVQNLCSYIVFAILLCVCVIMIIGLFFVNRKFKRSMIYVGVSLLFIGVLDCVIGMMTGKAAAVMNDIMAVGEDIYMTLLSPARTCSLILGGCVILAGVLAVVLPLILGKRQKTA